MVRAMIPGHSEHVQRTLMNTVVFDNTRVLTCDAGHTVAEAIAIRAGKVLTVGASDTVRASAGPDSRIIDLNGYIIVPGFIDTHPHLLHFGTPAEPLVDLGDARTHDDIADRIAARAAGVPPGEWIMTTPVGEPHYFSRSSHRDLAERELPDRAVLDRAAPGHPVFIQAWAPVVPSVCSMNTLALRRLGITAATPDRIGNIWIEKDPSGEPTGRLHGSVTNYYCDSDFWNNLLRQLPLLQPDAIIPGTEGAMRAANATGVTTIYESHLMTFSLIEIYRWLRAEDRLTLRVLCCPEAEPSGVPWTDPGALGESDRHVHLCLGEQPCPASSQHRGDAITDVSLFRRAQHRDARQGRGRQPVGQPDARTGPKHDTHGQRLVGELAHGRQITSPRLVRHQWRRRPAN